jgi:hypothetical protein
VSAELERAEREWKAAGAKLKRAQAERAAAWKRVLVARAAAREARKLLPTGRPTLEQLRNFHAERRGEIWRRREAAETFTAIAKAIGLSVQRVREIYWREWSKRNPAPPPPPEPPGKCPYCTGPCGRGAMMCRLCQQYGVLGRVLLGYEAPWDFHALRRKAAHGCAAD